MSTEDAREFREYQRLNEMLLAMSNPLTAGKQKSPRPLDISSINHHYIPIHFIKGFVNAQGLTWVYDKQTNRIAKNAQSSKSVFFEKMRNSIDLGGGFSLPLFEHYYSIFDNLFPIAIRLLRSDHNLTDHLMGELCGHLNVFFFDLYWRNINTDSMFDSIFDTSPISHRKLGLDVQVEVEESVLRSIPGVKQLSRINIVQKTIEEAKNNQLSYQPTHRTETFQADLLCLGDKPYVMQREPKSHLDLVEHPLIFPISSKKLYARNTSAVKPWDIPRAIQLNVVTIEQSSRYIICANKEVLELSIRAYHDIRERSMLSYCHQDIFK